jgi:hypothetical protein
MAAKRQDTWYVSFEQKRAPPAKRLFARATMTFRSEFGWTDEEDKRLLALRAARKSSVVIAAALRRSEASVVGRIYVLKKRRRRCGADGRARGSDIVALAGRVSPQEQQKRRG